MITPGAAELSVSESSD